MKLIIEDSNCYYAEGKIYIKGNYIEWYNEDEDCLEQYCPLTFVNLIMIDIDEDGIWLEQLTEKSLQECSIWNIQLKNTVGTIIYSLNYKDLKSFMEKIIK